MVLEVNKYNIIYAALLNAGINASVADVMAKDLLSVASVNDLLKQIKKSGIKFDSEVYKKLNSSRTNSSQIGFINLKETSFVLPEPNY